MHLAAVRLQVPCFCQRGLGQRAMINGAFIRTRSFEVAGDEIVRLGQTAVGQDEAGIAGHGLAQEGDLPCLGPAQLVLVLMEVRVLPGPQVEIVGDRIVSGPAVDKSGFGG